MFRTLLALILLVSPALAAEWTYTDGAGKTVTLPEPPNRIIAHINAAAALIPLGIKPIGVFLDGPPSVDRAMEDLDLTGVAIVGRGWYELDAEAVLALDPDLIITEYWPREGFYGGAVGDVAITGQIESIAPIVGPAQGKSILTMLDDFAALATSLGADPDAPAVLADRAAFDAALARFKSTVAAHPGLTVMAASPGSGGLSVAAPSEFAELSDFAAWGLDLVVPTTDPDSSYQTLSWENANLYPADIILLDDRWGSRTAETLAAQPLAERLPAVAAGQVGDWPAGWIRSYRVYAEQLDELTDLIERSDAGLVD
ncbi:ABC transporter substrate-binding protein [Devosia ginsengisoli]|uniref:ABC transporter substrate-binding protein n=1 Tax=Devosia ginsengisoli TaxID=400770 RepID=A0A5B8LSV8_9HYPH|nr:ABC transporter substrate-binding protein [Devosia ginsengisoli]QDZ11146.1 ABC transporter substrate-binding protein [Devosia ginsengisoli]